MPTQERKRIRPFADWLREQRKGALHDELSEKLADVAQGAMEHGKTGTLTVTFKVKPGEDEGILFVTDTVKATVPEGNRPSTIYYGDEEGNLERRNPRQPELPVREVPRAASRAPDSKTAEGA